MVLYHGASWCTLRLIWELLKSYSPPEGGRIWHIWASYYNASKPIVYLLKGSYTPLECSVRMPTIPSWLPYTFIHSGGQKSSSGFGTPPMNHSLKPAKGLMWGLHRRLFLGLLWGDTRSQLICRCLCSLWGGGHFTEHLPLKVL